MAMDAVLPSFEAVIVLVNLSAPHFTNSRPDFQSAAGAGALCLLPATQGPTKPIIATSPLEKYISKLGEIKFEKRQIHFTVCMYEYI